MKYNEPIVLEENEVHNIILKKIKKGSKVLEFGAASGRMTKLLTEDYGCEVFIIEYEREAFELAMRYAKEGMCTDIGQYEWKKWAGAGFDYILFCDVLEHLRDPKQVLRETRDLLKDSGSVFLSVPNIGHNDILIKLFYNEFKYTKIGLLDDTHIHFFSEQTLDSFVAGTGYAVISRQYKTIPTSMTEQYWDAAFCCTDGLCRALRQRENGDVYQFVLELKKETDSTDKQGFRDEIRYQPLHGLVYFDRGEGFSQNDVLDIKGRRVQEDEYEFTEELSLDADIVRIRIDPVERELCGLVRADCSLGRASIPNRVSVDGKEIIMDEDPRLIWEVPKGTTDISFTVRIRLSLDEIVTEMIHYYQFLERKLSSSDKDWERKLQASEQDWERKLELSEQRNEQCASMLSRKERELGEVYRSKSWRCTKILRKVNALAAKRRMGR